MTTLLLWTCVLFIAKGLIAGECPATWTTYKETCLKMSDDLTSWRGANRICEQAGGHLVTVDSAEKQKALQRLVIDSLKTGTGVNWVETVTAGRVNICDNDPAMSSSLGGYHRYAPSLVVGHYDVWLGLNDLQKRRSWTWAGDNSSIIYSNWAPGQPMYNTDPNQWPFDYRACIYMDVEKSTYLWSNEYCDFEKRYICEI